MKTIRTAKGTELPFLNLRGKEYLEVKYRLVWFREEHPTWSILTELIESTNAHTVAKAMIQDEQGRTIATAHKYEDKQGFGDYREKAETGAIGRALAFCGYGTQFEPELEEGERIVDSPVIPTVKRTVLPSGGVITQGVPEESTKREDHTRRLTWLYKPYMAAFPETVFKTLLMERYGVDETKLMTIEQLSDLVAFIEGRLKASTK